MKRKIEGERTDVYSRITDKIAADLEKGVRPWMQPWRAGNAVGRVTRPLRHNGLPYSGMNVLLLWSEAMARGYSSPTWMTFKQAIELGGAVRKGESGTLVVFASRFTKTEVGAAGEEVDKEIPFLKAYSAFNVAQIDGLPDRACRPLFRQYRRGDPPWWRQGLLFAGGRLHPDAAVPDVPRRSLLRRDPQP